MFLGRTYTKDIINLSEHVDGFINYDDFEKLNSRQRTDYFKGIGADVIVHVFPKKEIAFLAKRAGVPLRVGTRNRAYHWLSCNKLLNLSRKNSNLHEAQLNIKLLEFLGIDTNLSLTSIPTYYGFTKVPALDDKYSGWIDKTKFNLILHPKSKGSAKEWGMANFEKLILLLPKDQFKIFISGTADDAKAMKQFIQKNDSAMDITGKLSLQQFIAFINQCDGLVAASTGPLHIAAALHKTAVGLFSPKRPIHPGRWKPLGLHAVTLVDNPDCEKCNSGQECDCIMKIKPQTVVDLLLKKRHGSI